MVADAPQIDAPVPVIAQAEMQLFVSRDADREWAKAVVAIRHGFGGHLWGPDEYVSRERNEGRIGEFFKPRWEPP